MTREELSDDDDDFDKGDDLDDEATGISTVERLSSVEAWEMYRVVSQDTGLRIASMALGAARNGARAVDYAVWTAKDVEEPSATGTVDHSIPTAGWDDRARESVIRQVLCHYEDQLGVESDKAQFRFAGPEKSSDEEGSHGS
jgi:hypothetical protein